MEEIIIKREVFLSVDEGCDSPIYKYTLEELAFRHGDKLLVFDRRIAEPVANPLV